MSIDQDTSGLPAVNHLLINLLVSEAENKPVLFEFDFMFQGLFSTDDVRMMSQTFLLCET